MAAGFSEERAVAKTVSFPEIERILEVTDSLGFDRERVKIPLRCEPGGRIGRDARGTLEIVVDADVPFETWLAGLEERLPR